MPSASTNNVDWLLLAALAIEGLLLLLVLGLLVRAVLTATDSGVTVLLGSVAGLLGALVGLLLALVMLRQEDGKPGASDRQNRARSSDVASSSSQYAPTAATGPGQGHAEGRVSKSPMGERGPGDGASGPTGGERRPPGRGDRALDREQPPPEADAPFTGQRGRGTGIEESRLPRDEPEFERETVTTPPGMPPSDLAPQRLIDVWESYRSEGDGHFDAAGLRRKLQEAALDYQVLSARALGMGEEVLGVQSRQDGEVVFLLPNFNLTARALEPWFVDEGGAARTSRISRLQKPARGRKTVSGFTLEQKGTVA